MNKEERKAIEYYQDKEISFGVNFDTEKLLRTLGITEEDNFENHQIRFKTLLNLIDKLQKENEEYSKQIDLDYVDDNYIAKQKIKEKIEELSQYYKKEIYPSLYQWSDITITEHYDEMIALLQELLEEEK